MTTKTKRSKDAARPTATHGPATEKAKRAARKVIEQNIARIDAAEQAGAAPAEQNGQPQQPQADQQQPGQAEQPAATAATEGAPTAAQPQTPPTRTKPASAPGSKRGPKAKEGAKSQPAASTPAKGKKGGKAAKPPKATKEPNAKRLSCIDAAAQIIGQEAIGCADLVAEMGQRGLWTSPGGKTPEASLYAAIIREIAAKGDDARFRKVDRGLFVANTKKGA